MTAALNTSPIGSCTAARPVRVAAFLSHPIQHLTPLWQAFTKLPGTQLKVFYYSRHGVEAGYDAEFGVKLAWDVDLLAGHDHEFLSRQWPTKDPCNFGWNGLNSGLSRVLREGWDAVYVAGYRHLNNWRVARICKRLGIPVLSMGDTSILTALDKPRPLLMAKRVIVPAFYSMISGHLAIGDHSQAYFLHYGAAPERVFFCPIPVDIERFRNRVSQASAQELHAIRARYRIPADKHVLMFNGKLVPRKNPLDLVAAVQRLGRDNVVAVFVGEGELREQVERAGGAQAIVTGFVNQDEIPLLLSLATLSVMSSSYDAHPLAVTEALCLGLPVVLSDRCGCWGPNDVLRDGEDGLLYRCGDVDDLTAKLRLLFGDEPLRRRMSARARELADTQSPAAAAAQLYKAVCAVSDGHRKGTGKGAQPVAETSA